MDFEWDPKKASLHVRDHRITFDYRLENDPRFLQRVEQARESIRSGRGVKLEDVK